ncbi:MAG: hypothetical protein AAFZ65_13550 [Planctomycetota bacterium]
MAERAPLAAGLAIARLELRRALPPPLVAAGLALGLWLSQRSWTRAGAALASELAEPAPEVLVAQARAGVWSVGAALAAAAWLWRLARAHDCAAGVERSTWALLDARPVVRGTARWAGRVAGAGLLLLWVGVAAEIAARGGPVRPLRAQLEHPGRALLDPRERVTVGLPELDRGALRVELGSLPGTGPLARARVRLARIPADSTARNAAVDLQWSGRRRVDLALPSGDGALVLELATAPDSAAVFLPRDSLAWVGEPTGGARASAALWVELFLALGTVASLWPLLRRQLDPLVSAATVALPWITAWLGAPHAGLWPGGLLPAQLDLVRGALAPTLDPLRIGISATLVALALWLEARRVRARGEELRA